MIRPSHLSWRFVSVWRRNLIVYRRIWKINFLVPLLEPIFYILAFGIGFQGLIGAVDYAGASLAYIRFMAPALISIAIMYNAFFETTYASYVRMEFQKTFDGMMATPLSLFLARQIKLDKAINITRVTRMADGFSITARDGRKEAEVQITLTFSEAPLALIGWTVTDAQGASTRIRLTSLAKTSGLAPSLFVLKDPRPKNVGRSKM